MSGAAGTIQRCQVLLGNGSEEKTRHRLPDLALVTFQAKLARIWRRPNALLRWSKNWRRSAPPAANSRRPISRQNWLRNLRSCRRCRRPLRARSRRPEEVWTRLRSLQAGQHEDSIPRTPAGQLVSIADKLDTLRGCFTIGLIPTGSRDPFALRRAAQGVVRFCRAKLRCGSHIAEGDAKLEELSWIVSATIQRHSRLQIRRSQRSAGLQLE